MRVERLCAVRMDYVRGQLSQYVILACASKHELRPCGFHLYLHIDL